MDSNKSVIVVGAGVSGLTAAALLAKRGLSVTVIEGTDRPGGACSAFRRRGVTYDLGAAMLFGFGERGFNPHRWLMDELGEDLDVYRHEALYRINYGTDGIVFWPELDRFLDGLGDLFPGARDEIGRFYASIREIYEKVIAKVPVFEAPTEIPAREARRRFIAAPLVQLRALGLMARSAESLMRPFVRDRAARRFFDKLTSTYCYTTMRETPAILVATMFVDNHVGGSYYPAGSPMSLAARLEKAVEAGGGEILYRERLAALESRGSGKTPALRLASGKRLEADLVLFAGAVKELCESLDPGNVLPKAWKRRVLAMDDSWPSFVVYGTVEKSALPAGAMPVEMFIDNREALDEGDVTLYLSSLEDPGLAPEGLSTFLLIGPSFRSWPRPGEPAYGGASYLAAKRAEGDRMLSLVEKRWPGFIAGIRSRLEGSPTTIERYLGKPLGSVAGPKQRMGQHLFLRPSARTRVPGFYLSGEGTVMGTGTPAVTVSGISAANAILRDSGLPAFEAGASSGGAVRVIPRGRPGNLPRTEAGLAARECQWCEDAPCMKRCPWGVDIPGVMRRLEANNLEGARRAATAKATPSPCALCAEERAKAGERPAPCETACTRQGFAGRAVRIEALVRSAAGGLGVLEHEATGREAPSLRP